jgi:hypothetical protein
MAESDDWKPLKGTLLQHIIANCCFSEEENTVIIGQDNNRDQIVDKCYQLRGIEKRIYYREIQCPENLTPLVKPKKSKIAKPINYQ